MKKYAIILFGDEKVAYVPSNWIFNVNGTQKCHWPKKKLNIYRHECLPPEKDSCIFKIRKIFLIQYNLINKTMKWYIDFKIFHVLYLFSDSIKEARRKELDAQNLSNLSSGDELQIRQKKKYLRDILNLEIVYEKKIWKKHNQILIIKQLKRIPMIFNLKLLRILIVLTMRFLFKQVSIEARKPN